MSQFFEEAEYKLCTLYDNESEDNTKTEDVKVLVSNISSNTSLVDIFEYDVFTDNVDNFSQLVSDDPFYQALFNK